VRGHIDALSDPDGLGNVCHPGQPLWLNRYYAAGQRQAFSSLLEDVPPPTAKARALDVGCGTARWSRLLDERGYEVTGIDLQEEVIERNRRLFPQIRFVPTSAQEFMDDIGYALVTSVTVLQHIPFEEQATVVNRLRDLLTVGGHAVFLENIHDQAPHVFSRSLAGWLDLFQSSGLRPLRVRRYDYNPSLRLAAWIKASLMGRRHEPNLSPETYLTNRPLSHPRRLARTAARVLDRVALSVDSVIEVELVRRGSELPSIHCGFLLERP
jgi:SAM-dependent methyltransferase